MKNRQQAELKLDFSYTSLHRQHHFSDEKKNAGEHVVHRLVILIEMKKPLWKTK